MPGIDFVALRDQVSIQDVLTLLRFRPTSRRGTTIRGCCPLQCSDDRRAFAVDIKLNKYYCHRCHRSGNQLDLWCVTQGLSIHPAAKDLCASLGIPVPETHRW